MNARIIFMGTPDFAVPALTKLHQAYQVIAVVTQPDRPRGRGQKLVTSPVKQEAEEAGLTILQPHNLKAPQVVAQLHDLKPDVIVVAAFGQILRANVLNLPPMNCLNIHASLLPRWRGAAPVAAAIRAGDAETGITLMKMDEGLDTGPIIRAHTIPIRPDHTRESLTNELAHLGASLLINTLPAWLAGEITPQPQDDALATLAPRLKKEEGQINWQQSAVEIDCHVRAFYPWPGTFTYWKEKMIKILSVLPVNEGAQNLTPGQVFELDKKIVVATGQGAVVLKEIQPAGKRAMLATDFVRGAPNFVGAHLY